jgi:hypothetical protein
MTTPEYVNFRLKKETQRKLRILAAHSDESMIDLIDRLATEEQARCQEKLVTVGTYSLTGNAWVKRVDELRRKVSDLPDAPTSLEEVHYYISSPSWQKCSVNTP